MKRKKIGILGGGQLARMLALKAHPLGLEPYVLSPSKEDPAAKVTRFWIKGHLDRISHLKLFLKKTDIVTFENEFINTSLLLQAMKEVHTKIIPHPRVIEKFQDRWLQKKLLEEYNIPTSPFLKIDSYSDLLNAFEYFREKMVLKKRRFGYDGNGTFIIKNKKELKKCKFLFKNKTNSSTNAFTGFIAEKFIPFQKELALILVSHKNSEVISLPLVETFQKNFQCYWVKGPVSHVKIHKLTALLKNFIKKIEYEGVITFEIFQSLEGLLINETAPRVHNSGHYSLNALSKDQFTLHLESVLRRPIQPPTLLCKGFAMLNLLGQREIKSDWQKSKGIFLHEYGKKERKKGRKMGHLNACTDSPEKALNQLLKVKKYFS